MFRPSFPPRSCTTTRIRSFDLGCLPRPAAERPRNVGIVVEPIATSVLDESDVFKKRRRLEAHRQVLPISRFKRSAKLVLGRSDDQPHHFAGGGDIGGDLVRGGLFDLLPGPGIERAAGQQIDKKLGERVAPATTRAGCQQPRDRSAGRVRRFDRTSKPSARLVRASIAVELIQAGPPSQPATLGGAYRLWPIREHGIGQCR